MTSELYMINISINLKHIVKNYKIFKRIFATVFSISSCMIFERQFFK